MDTNYGFETLQAHAGFTPDPLTGARAVPIYQTSAYQFEDAADAAAQLALEKPGYIYGRIGNPTTAVLEDRLTALTGGAATVCFASGMAAILACIQSLAESGSEVVSMSTIYGGTYTLLFSRFAQRYGITPRRVDPEDFAGLEAAINKKTRCVYLETIGNPNINIPDIEAIANIAHAHGLPVVLDNTFGTPYLFPAKAFGVDFEVHSLTKYIGGHGNSMGGSVTDLGTFSFKGNPRFLEYNEPDKSYHGLVYADLGAAGFATKLRACFLRDTGACLSPFNAFLLLMGLETLSLRMNKHTENTMKVAAYLKAHPRVSWIRYPGLEGDAYFERQQKYMPRGAGGIFTFGVKGGAEAGRKFIDSLKLIPLVVNVSDVRSMVVHPASTTHSQLNAEELAAAGVSADMVRVSVGLEDADDLIADIAQALEKAAV